MARPTRDILVQNERQTKHGWAFDVSRGPSSADTLEVQLSWADYEYWTHGSSPPARVVEMLMRALEELRPDAELGGRVDASTLRRVVGGQALDEWLKERL